MTSMTRSKNDEHDEGDMQPEDYVLAITGYGKVVHLRVYTEGP